MSWKLTNVIQNIKETKLCSWSCADALVTKTKINNPIQKFVYIATSIGGRYCMMQLSFEWSERSVVGNWHVICMRIINSKLIVTYSMWITAQNIHHTCMVVIIFIQTEKSSLVRNTLAINRGSPSSLWEERIYQPVPFCIYYDLGKI